MNKFVKDLIVDTTEVQYSEAVSIGGNNAAMFEIWLKSLSGTLQIYSAGPPLAGFEATLQGSNDKLKWEDAHGGSSIDNASNQVVPQYLKNTATTVIPYEFLRLKFEAGGGSAVLLVDASIRTFTTS